MGSSEILQNILSFIVRSRNIKNVLEVGTFTGMSAIAFALFNKGCRVTTIEKFDEFANIAKKNIAHYGLSNRIKVIIGDAKDCILKLKNKYDLVFIDGDKEHYLDYFIYADKIVNRNGLIVIDDIFFHGDVFNTTPQTIRGKGVKKMLRALVEYKDRYTFTIIPISNGLLICEKK